MLIGACNISENNNMLLQKRIDSLEIKLADTYKPGFGEFMGNIQTHHAKLWLAGQNGNWKLADFEIHEMIEAIDNIKKYQTERKESQNLSLLDNSIENVKAAIKEQNQQHFKLSFNELTNTCNNCHRAVSFEFCVVKIPDYSAFANQDFKPDSSIIKSN